MELNLSSDALRLALIYKHGGWYADIDTVIMKPLSKLVESHPGGTFYISSDQKNGSILKIGFYLSKCSHFHCAYVIGVLPQL